MKSKNIEETKSINVACSCSDFFYNSCKTMLYSLRKNNDNIIRLYFFGELSNNNKKDFQSFCNNNRFQVDYINIDSSFLNIYFDENAHWFLTLKKILLPYLLTKVDRLLYIDSDIVVNRDINDLYATNIEDSAIAAAPDFGDSDFDYILRFKERYSLDCYYNCGLVLFNCAFIRKQYPIENLEAFIKEYSDCFKMFDQDILNLFFKNSIVCLDSKYNYQCRFFVKERYRDINKNIIIHFTYYKPWQIEYPFCLKKAKCFWKYGKKVFTKKEIIIIKLKQIKKLRIFLKSFFIIGKRFFNFFRSLNIRKGIIRAKKSNHKFFMQPYGRGDYTVLFSLLIPFCSLNNGDKTTVFVPVNRKEVISCFSKPRNLSYVYIKYGEGFTKNNPTIIDFFDKKSDKYGITFIKGIPETNDNIESYSSCHEVTWKYYFKQTTPLPNPPSLPIVPKEKEYPSLKYLCEMGDYILLNTNTPSMVINDNEVFFAELIKNISTQHPNIRILSNNVPFDNADTLSCDFYEMYYYIKHSKCFISIRSGIEDFSIGSGANFISIYPKGETLVSFWSSLKKWRVDSNILEIFYDYQNKNLAIEKILKHLDSLLK